MDAEAPSAAEAPCPAPADVSEAPPPSVCLDEDVCAGDDGEEEDPTSVHSLDALYDMWSAGALAFSPPRQRARALSPLSLSGPRHLRARARAQASWRSTRCTR